MKGQAKLIEMGTRPHLKAGRNQNLEWSTDRNKEFLLSHNDENVQGVGIIDDTGDWTYPFSMGKT